jgi:hypothetical protein
VGRDPRDKRDTRAVIQAVADAYPDNWGDPTIKVPHGTPAPGFKAACTRVLGTRMAITAHGGVPAEAQSNPAPLRHRRDHRRREELGLPCPTGFRFVRVHDLKHTFGYRLRTAGVQFEDRQTLRGHKAAHVTTHYSAADIENLISFAEKVCELFSRKSLALRGSCASG